MRAVPIAVGPSIHGSPLIAGSIELGERYRTSYWRLRLHPSLADNGSHFLGRSRSDLGGATSTSYATHTAPASRHRVGWTALRARVPQVLFLRVARQRVLREVIAENADFRRPSSARP